jgi:hypothetical protein
MAPPDALRRLGAALQSGSPDKWMRGERSSAMRSEGGRRLFQNTTSDGSRQMVLLPYYPNWRQDASIAAVRPPCPGFLNAGVMRARVLSVVADPGFPLLFFSRVDFCQIVNASPAKGPRGC